MPAKKLDKVSCRAREIAKPPTPKVVRMGTSEIPIPSRITNMPKNMKAINITLDIMLVAGKILSFLEK